MILDLGLPDLDGQEVITLIREHSQVPIIVLSVRANETDKVEALDRGADDYVVKPFGIGELMARVRAASRQRSAAASDPDTLRIGALTIDLTRRLVIRDGAEQRLSPKEHALLGLLARNRDKILTHTQILREVWGPAHTHDTAYLRVYVNQLRQKLEADPGRPALIITEPGVRLSIEVRGGPLKRRVSCAERTPAFRFVDQDFSQLSVPTARRPHHILALVGNSRRNMLRGRDLVSGEIQRIWVFSSAPPPALGSGNFMAPSGAMPREAGTLSSHSSFCSSRRKRRGSPFHISSAMP